MSAAIRALALSGVEVEATQVEGPTVILTIDGEVCAKACDWVVQALGGWPVVLDDEAFSIAYRRFV
jgi:hypothetical protein